MSGVSSCRRRVGIGPLWLRMVVLRRAGACGLSGVVELCAGSCSHGADVVAVTVQFESGEESVLCSVWALMDSCLPVYLDSCFASIVGWAGLLIAAAFFVKE